MERSMIQDLEGMRTSMGVNRKTFTTSFNPGSYELRKSKISNLPSYKKSDMSLKLPFVVVFQAMEIERLSEEIEALRVALKDTERQAFNCQSYEIQIRELTDQCHQYDVELLEYKDEIEKLNTISQKLYEELEDWKDKYQNFDPMVVQKYNAKTVQCKRLEEDVSKWRDRYRALEKGKDQEMEDLKLAMENQRRSVLDRQMGELNLKFEAERSYLVNQIKKLEEAADYRQNELTNTKYEAEALRIENEVNLDASRKLKESENKLNKLTEQLVRINQILRRKQQQISRKESNEDYLKQIIKTLQREKMSHQNEAIKVPQLESIIKEWSIRHSRLQNETVQYKDQLKKLPILEKDIINYMEECDKLQSIVRNKIAELNQCNQRADKFRTLYEESKRIQQKVPGLERKITEMAYESERLNDTLKKRLIQVEDGKTRILTLEKALRAFEQAEPQKRRIQEELKRQVREVQRLKKNIKDLQKQLQKIPELEAMLAEQRNTQEEYAREIDRLNKAIKQKTEEIQIYHEKVMHLQEKVEYLSNIEQEINNYKQQNNRMVQQIDTMNAKIKEKCELLDELDIAIRNLQDNLEHYKAVEQKLKENIEQNEKIMSQLDNTKEELQKTQQNLLNCEQELNEAKNTIIDINNDKEMLNRNLNIKLQELDQAHAEINQYCEQISQLQEIQRQYHILQDDLRLTQTKLEETQGQLRNEKAINEELQYKTQMLINELESIRINGHFPEEFRGMYEQVKANAQTKHKQMQNLVKKQAMLENYIVKIQQVIVGLCETTKSRNSNWLQTNKKIQDSISSINKLTQLQNENNELKQNNLDLESQIKVLNLEILEVNAKRSAGNSVHQPIDTFMATASSSSSSSLNFNSVTSKKGFDSVVEGVPSKNRASVLENVKPLGGITNLNTISMNKVGGTNTKSRVEQLRSSDKFTTSRTSKINPIMTSTSNSKVVSGYLGSYVSPSKLPPHPKDSTESTFSWNSSKLSVGKQVQSSYLNTCR